MCEFPFLQRFGTKWEALYENKSHTHDIYIYDEKIDVIEKQLRPSICEMVVKLQLQIDLLCGICIKQRSKRYVRYTSMI